MPKALIDGVAIYYESHGEGFPLVLCHEFAGDYRSWEHQVGFFSRRYRVITYNARGYPPSDVPDDPDAYSQDRSVEDLKGLLDHLGIESAHIGGLSMGGSVTLHFGIRYPKMARSLIVAGTGTGSVDPDAFRLDHEQVCAADGDPRNAVYVRLRKESHARPASGEGPDGLEAVRQPVPIPLQHRIGSHVPGIPDQAGSSL